MYLGPREQTILAHSTRYDEYGRGVPYRLPVTRTVHDYRCEHCGWKPVGQLLRADEPFYCNCGRLISIEPVASLDEECARA